MHAHRYAIALGSNRRHGRHGEPRSVIAAALSALAAEGLDIISVSPVIRTPALGPGGRGFANAAAIVATSLDPPALLALLKNIERGFGRRRGRRWGARVLDLDIALWSAGRWSGRHLTVPHRELANRDFVLRPLLAIAPLWRVGRHVGTIRHAHARLVRAKPVDRAALGQ